MDTLTSLLISWYMPGSILILHPVCLHIFKISFRSCASIVGTARMISLIPNLTAYCIILCRPPTTGTPFKKVPHFLESSSMMQRTSFSTYWLFLISFKIIFPASPAPISITAVGCLSTFCSGIFLPPRSTRIRILGATMISPAHPI